MPDVDQIMVAEGSKTSPGTEDVKLENVSHEGGGGGGFDPSSLDVSTNVPADADEIVTGESGTWYRKAFSKVWNYIKTKIGISSQGDAGKYLNEQGIFTTPPSGPTYTIVSTTEDGLAPKVTDTSKFLKGDGTWAMPPSGPTYTVVSTTEDGLAPQVTDTNKFLKGDGTWAMPPIGPTYDVFSLTQNGLTPKGGGSSKNPNHYLFDDGTWGWAENQRIDFTSDDTTDANATSWTILSKITSNTLGNLMNSISAMMKNTRYLYNRFNNVGTITSKTVSLTVSAGWTHNYSPGIILNKGIYLLFIITAMDGNTNSQLGFMFSGFNGVSIDKSNANYPSFTVATNGTVGSNNTAMTASIWSTHARSSLTVTFQFMLIRAT